MHCVQVDSLEQAEQFYILQSRQLKIFKLNIKKKFYFFFYMV